MIKVGDTVAVFSENAPNWATIADLGLVMGVSGGISENVLVFIPRYTKYEVIQEDWLLPFGSTDQIRFAEFFFRKLTDQRCIGAYQKPGFEKIDFEVAATETEFPRASFSCQIGANRISIEAEYLSIEVPQSLKLSRDVCILLLRKFLDIQYWTTRG